MIIIYGYRRFVRQLAMLMLVCRGCGNPAAHTVKRVKTWATLFYIPVFPIAPSRFYTQCTFCGATNRLTRQQAEQLQAQDQEMRQAQQYQAQPQQYPAQPPAPQQYQPQPPGPQQYPAQPY